MAVLSATAAPLLVGAADHLESPNAKANHALDITDIYAFDGANSKNTVLVMNVNPLAGVVSGTKFATDGTYRFNIDRNGDDVADDVYTVTFGAANAANGKQPLTLKKDGTTVLTGKTGNANNGGGAKLYAGIKDDPFFFDLRQLHPLARSGRRRRLHVHRLDDLRRCRLLQGHQHLDDRPRDPGQWLGYQAAYWGTTKKGTTLIDRMGKPALATVFMNPFGGDDQKDPYNQTAPSADVSTWGGQFTAVLDVFNQASTASAITGLLLPDVLTLDVRTSASRPGPRSPVTRPATSSTGARSPRTSSTWS